MADRLEMSKICCLNGILCQSCQVGFDPELKAKIGGIGTVKTSGPQRSSRILEARRTGGADKPGLLTARSVALGDTKLKTWNPFIRGEGNP